MLKTRKLKINRGELSPGARKRYERQMRILDRKVKPPAEQLLCDSQRITADDLKDHRC